MMEGETRPQMTAILPRRGGESVPRPRVRRVCVPLCACARVRVRVLCGCDHIDVCSCICDEEFERPSKTRRYTGVHADDARTAIAVEVRNRWAFAPAFLCAHDARRDPLLEAVCVCIYMCTHAKCTHTQSAHTHAHTHTQHTQTHTHTHTHTLTHTHTHTCTYYVP
jgi:hypothetical protein